MRDERLRPVVEPLGPHKHDLRAGDFGDLFVTQVCFCFGGISWPVKTVKLSNARGAVERNARVIRRHHHRRNAGYNLKMHFRCGECLGSSPPRQKM